MRLEPAGKGCCRIVARLLKLWHKNGEPSFRPQGQAIHQKEQHPKRGISPHPCWPRPGGGAANGGRRPSPQYPDAPKIVQVVGAVKAPAQGGRVAHWPFNSAPQHLGSGRQGEPLFDGWPPGVLPYHWGRAYRGLAGGRGFPPTRISAKFRPRRSKARCAGYSSGATSRAASGWTTGRPLARHQMTRRRPWRFG